MSLKNLPYEVSIHEIDKGEHSCFPFELTVSKLKHSSKCYGYRFKLNKKIITFATDTGICAGLYEVAWDADVLFTECALLPNEESEAWPHLGPKDAALVARDARVKKLYLLHFDAEKYKTVEKREIALIEANFFLIVRISV
jgi:ribonuclease BN (tRNA processing enzyme)